MTDKLFADHPISHPKDDAFGLSTFADALATSLLKMSPADGLVISVEGPWGSGKSSAIALTTRTIKLRVLTRLGEGQDELEKLTSEELDEKWEEKAKARNTHIVRFNPWNFSGQENLVRAFFGELAGQLRVKPDSWIRRMWKWAVNLMPTLSQVAATGGALLSGSGAIAAAAGGLGRALGEAGRNAVRIDKSIEGAKKKLVKALRASDQRIIVIIDDLDRLMPSEMRSVFSLVKSLGDLPNVLYVLSFDDSVVQKALQDSAERIDPAFLEKIVQVSLKLPPPWREELRRLFFKRLNAIIGDAKIANNRQGRIWNSAAIDDAKIADKRRWERIWSNAIDPYLETPRDVTRLINTLKVIWPNVAGDVDPADLIAITSLQLFDPEVYAFIRDNIEIITNADHRYENEKAFGERMIPKAAKKLYFAKESIALMFPRIAKAWNNHSQEGTSYIVQKEQRRICTKEYHRNYFAVGRDRRMLSRAEVESIVIADDPDRALSATLKRLADDPAERQAPKIPTLLMQISEAVYAKPILTPALLRALLDKSDMLIEREDEIWEFSITNNHQRLGTIIRFGLERLDAAQRAQILELLVTYNAGLQTRSDFIEDQARSHGLYGGEQQLESNRLFPYDRIEAASIAIRDQIASACESGEVWNAPMPIKLICAWKRMDSQDASSRWLRNALGDDDLVVRLANELPGKSYQTGGNHGTRIVWVFRRHHWQSLFEVDELFSRLESLAPNNADAAQALNRLREAEEANHR